ncbi:MAG: hypothetical protein HY437_00800 [Candidatus Magasanikbacteria bacterium]|nr:hypothetical protein [Candidatus Magasanikbacteria bacterium]
MKLSVTMRHIRVLGLVLVSLFALGFIAGAVSGCGEQGSVETAWNVYHGAVPGYTVEIDEVQHDNVPVWRRIVHLYPILAQREQQVLQFSEQCGSWCGITGHDYTGDGRWDRVFLCRYPEHANGCNSILFEDGITKWEPCNADEGRVQPFSEKDLAIAMGQLYLGLATVHDVEHRRSTLEEFKAKLRKDGTIK